MEAGGAIRCGTVGVRRVHEFGVGWMALLRMELGAIHRSM